MTNTAVKPTNHAMIRLRERFPKEWKQLGFENVHKSMLHLSATNLKLVAELFAKAKKVNSLINDKAMAVYCMERFGCPDPHFYVAGNVVFVVRANCIITVMDKQLDARNHIKGFESASSKRKKVGEPKAEENLYITEGSFLKLIKDRNSLLTYTPICQYSKEYEVVLASYRDKEMYFLRALSGQTAEQTIFFKTSEEKEQLKAIRAWATALATIDDPMYQWIREGSAQLQLKYTNTAWVYTQEYERVVLTFSWNPIVQKGAILDFPIHSQSSYGAYINVNNYKYIKMATTGEAKKICAVAYNRYLYQVESLSAAHEILYFVHEPGTSYWYPINKSSGLYALMARVESEILPWVKNALSSEDFNVYKRTQRQTETYLFNSGEDNAFEFEVKKVVSYDRMGAPEDTWIISPLMMYYISKELATSTKKALSGYSEVLEYAIQLQHDKRAYSVVDNEGQMPICSVEIGGKDYYYKVASNEMHKVAKVYEASQQEALRALYHNINLIKSQLSSWIETGRATTIRCDAHSMVVGVRFDGYFFIFQKQAGHSHFTVINHEDEAYRKYSGWHQDMETAVWMSPRTRVLTYVKRTRRTHVYTLDVATLQDRFSLYYNKWTKDTETTWRQSLPPIYLLQVEGEPIRMATRGEYGEILQHELAANALLQQLQNFTYSKITLTDATKGHVSSKLAIDSPQAQELVMLKIDLPPAKEVPTQQGEGPFSREVIVSVDLETEAIQATREDFMVMAHWNKHNS